MKIRITKEREEDFELFLELLKSEFLIKNISKPYKNRNGCGERIYIDLEKK